MALLTIVDAVRLTGVSRARLYRYLKSRPPQSGPQMAFSTPPNCSAPVSCYRDEMRQALSP